MSHYIPHHLLFNILVRLPIDSLIRARCVSKSWCDLIDSAYFTQLHLKRSNLDRKIIALKGMTLYTFDWVRKQDGGNYYRAVNAKKLRDLPSDDQVARVEIVGSSNGMLCLWDISKDDLVLWNPWINKRFVLPSFPFDSTRGESCWSGAGFGYDHKNNDYKVVKWQKLANSLSYLFDKTSCDAYELYVYSLKLNSWRRITDDMPFELPKSHDCAFSNGALHWLVRKMPVDPDVAGPDPDDYIVAFDLGSEEFRKIASPPVPEWYVYEIQKLCSLNGRLSCISSYTSGARLVGDLWVMEDYGVESSWTKLASIYMDGLSRSNFRPIAFSEKSGKMLLQVGWKKLVVYDVESKSIKDVTINDEPTCATSCACVGGLVSPCS